MKKLLVITLSALVAGGAVLQAKPARRGAVELTQPDGTKISVIRVGDEMGHLTLTPDSLPLVQDAAGFYCLATVEADGSLLSTGVRANEQGASASRVRSQWQASDNRAMLDRALGARRAASRVVQEGMGSVTSGFPKTGEVRGLVFLVQYTDVQFTISNPHEHFYNMLNQDGYNEYGGTGSAREFFIDNSENQFQPTFDVYGPVTLPNNQAYYGGNDWFGNDQNPEQMVIHAATILDDEVDFSLYDNDNDGYVDNVYVFYAGQGEAGYGSSSTVWPHSWDITAATSTPIIHDGVRLDHYACSNELESTTPDGIGTFVHEFSHVMGLPDLYNTQSSSVNYTPHGWSVLDYGCYANDSRTPTGYSSFERNAMGWLHLVPITSASSIILDPLNESNEAYMIATSKTTEFFLFENRQKRGWDTYLPGHGMLIWHIDFVQSKWDTNTVNNTQNHQYVDIVEANNARGNDTSTQAGYTWPGTSHKTEFTFSTTPSFRSWSGADLGLPITGIVERSNGVVEFDVDGGFHELVAPTEVRMVKATPISIELAWKAQVAVDGYQVNVTDTDGNAVATLVAPTNSCEITDLDYSTDYVVTVAALRGEEVSEWSEPLTVRTADFTFDYAQAEVEPATEISFDGFTANWKTVEGAAGYLLKVRAHFESAPVEYSYGFGSGTTAEVPEGWTFSGGVGDRYTASGYYGKEAPSLKLNVTGANLTTGQFEGDIVGIRFWHRGAGTNGTTTNFDIDVCGLDGEWANVVNMKPDPAGSTVEIAEGIPAGARRLRFVLFKGTAGNLALDDVEVTIMTKAEPVLEGFDDLDVGNTTSYRVDAVVEGVNVYDYTVVAYDAEGVQSRRSDMASVDLQSSGVEMVVPGNDSDAPAVYYNLSGQRVSGKLVPGIYVERRGSHARKVVVK